MAKLNCSDLLNLKVTLRFQPGAVAIKSRVVVQDTDAALVERWFSQLPQSALEEDDENTEHSTTTFRDLLIFAAREDAGRVTADEIVRYQHAYNQVLRKHFISALQSCALTEHR